ncbi:MAG: M23 family metallopeptidase, partial [Parcubacteria group bacterium]|nr:M23 family metallopeptidase [Parcubacteria group bacterium]
YANRNVTSRFGDDWNNTYCGGLIKKHNGADFSATAGTAVFAAESGYVKQVLLASQTDGWAQNIVMEHTTPNGQKYTTVSWHVNSWVSVVPGLITKGTQIGTVANLTPYGHATHFHFGVRIGAYSTAVFNGTNYAGTGGLPQTDCQKDASSSWYPAFPAGFVDPNDVNNVLFQ